MKFYTYILWSEVLQRYYVGSTNDLEDRLHRHNTAQGKYTARGSPWILIWSSDFRERKQAFNLEHKIKKRGIKRFLKDNNIFGK
jgi:putative endonuclease